MEHWVVEFVGAHGGEECTIVYEVWATDSAKAAKVARKGSKQHGYEFKYTLRALRWDDGGKELFDE